MKNIVTDFGADPTFVNDSTSAIQNALNSGPGEIFVPSGSYKITSPVTMSIPYQSLIGESKQGAKFISSSTGATIKLAANLVYGEIKNLYITRLTAASSGQDGIQSLAGMVNLCNIDNVMVDNHYVGMNLTGTGYSYITQCYTGNNYSHGIQLITTAPGQNALGWTIQNSLSELNNGCGLFITAGAGGGASLGEINNFSTYANGQYGVAVVGRSGSGMHGFRMQGGFIGNDRSGGLYLNTYGLFTHKVDGLVTELCGTSAGGRGLSIPVSNAAYGILVSVNNPTTVLTGCICRNHSLSGAYLAGSFQSVSGGDYSSNGAAQVAGNRNGIYLGAGSTSVNNAVITGNQYGLSIANDNHNISNCIGLANNTTAPYVNAVKLVKTKYLNNL